MFETGFSSRFKRIVASFIDGILVGIVSFIPFYFVTAKDGIMSIYTQHRYDVWVLQFLLPTLYYMLLHGPFGKGQTIGKKLMNLRVVTINGQILDNRQAFLRYAYYGLIPGIGSMATYPLLSGSNAQPSHILAWVLMAAVYSYCVLDILFLFIDPGRRTLHDFLARTVVVSHKGDLHLEKINRFVESGFPVFSFKRKWGLSLAAVCLVLAFSFSFFSKMMIQQDFNPFAQKAEHNFMVTFPPKEGRGERLELAALEIKKVSEAERKANIQQLVADLVKQGKLPAQKEVRMVVMGQMKVNVFKMRESVETMMKETKYYTVDPVTKAVEEKADFPPYAGGDMVSFLKGLDLKMFAKPWELYAQYWTNDFAFFCFTVRHSEYADFYIAVTRDDQPIRFSTMLPTLGKGWKQIVIKDGEPARLALDEKTAISVTKVSVSYAATEKPCEGYEGSFSLKGRMLRFLWKPCDSHDATLIKLLNDIRKANE